MSITITGQQIYRHNKLTDFIKKKNAVYMIEYRVKNWIIKRVKNDFFNKKLITFNIVIIKINHFTIYNNLNNLKCKILLECHGLFFLNL